MMKGIILAGGRGERLAPLTSAVSKQLLPVYDKPLVYYPLSTLLAAGIREILLITTPESLALFRQLLGDGSRFGCTINYSRQPQPDGLPRAFIIGKEFIGTDPVTLILGDNIFHGENFEHNLRETVHSFTDGCTVFGCRVADPSRYGVFSFDVRNRINSVIEKPLHPPSPYAVTGLYMFDNSVVQRSRHLSKSKRGEYEITDLINSYLAENTLTANLLNRENGWFDAGTPDALLDAANYIRALEQRTGVKTGCPELAALHSRLLSAKQLQNRINAEPTSAYNLCLLTAVSEYRPAEHFDDQA